MFAIRMFSGTWYGPYLSEKEDSMPMVTADRLGQGSIDIDSPLELAQSPLLPLQRLVVMGGPGVGKPAASPAPSIDHSIGFLWSIG